MARISKSLELDEMGVVATLQALGLKAPSGCVHNHSYINCFIFFALVLISIVHCPGTGHKAVISFMEP